VLDSYDGTLYAGSDQTLYKSTDQGVSWQPLIKFNDSSITLSAIYVNHLNYVFAAPDVLANSASSGIWRSVDAGQTWVRVMRLPVSCSTLSMGEDSNGNLFFGIYTYGTVANASICKSTDGGAHWTIVYYNSTGRHVHGIAVDKSNNYIYATLGDENVGPCHASVIRSTDDGSTWQQILVLPQMLAVEVIDTTTVDGKLQPAARLFATDYLNGQIYRRTDDVNFNLVLDIGVQGYCYWIRANDLNGQLYASFVAGEHPTQWIAGIWTSTNNGLTWKIYQSFTTQTMYCGSGAASDFVQGNLYFTIVLDSGWQNGLRIYPDYSGSSQTQSQVANLGLLLNIGKLQSINSESMLTITAFAITIIALSSRTRKKLANTKLSLSTYSPFF
jgi:hypothetical protein